VLLTVVDGAGEPLRLLFSGDLGRYDAPILPDPEPPPEAEYLIVESTYGDRAHPPESAAEELEREVLAAVARGGAIVIPAFAVGRTQEVLFLLRELEQAGRIPVLPTYVDSPMATDVTPVYRSHREDHDGEMDALLDRGIEPLRPRRLVFTRSPEESKALNRVHGPCIIVSASGMATGGRVLHHLERRLPDPSTTILLVGFQAAGTRGASLASGASTVRMHGKDIAVRARVVSLPGFSAHGDRGEVSRWLDGLSRPPRRTFCVHGEPQALAAHAARIEARGWKVHVPTHLETVELT
jgi:metallo-beta-lactamase family protein